MRVWLCGPWLSLGREYVVCSGMSSLLRSILRLQQAHLPQYRGMIPIDALTGEFVTAKLHDDDNIHGDFFVRWGDIWQKPGHWLTVGEREVQFIHELPLANHSVDRRHL
jgi:hypothetical protein